MSKSNLIRGRNWTFILYPDSCNKNFKSIIDDLHISWCLSPYHDKDTTINYETGEIEKKKEHYHVLLTFEGNKSYEQIYEICSSVNGVMPPLDAENSVKRTCCVSSIRGMVRYFTHIDNPDKFLYDKTEIECHGGMEIDEYFSYKGSAIKSMIAEMQAYCDANSVYEFSDLMDYSIKNKYDTWFDLLTVGKQSYIMQTYLTSKRLKKTKPIQED